MGQPWANNVRCNVFLHFASQLSADESLNELMNCMFSFCKFGITCLWTPKPPTPLAFSGIVHKEDISTHWVMLAHWLYSVAEPTAMVQKGPVHLPFLTVHRPHEWKGLSFPSTAHIPQAAGSLHQLRNAPGWGTWDLAEDKYVTLWMLCRKYKTTRAYSLSFWSFSGLCSHFKSTFCPFTDGHSQTDAIPLSKSLLVFSGREWVMVKRMGYITDVLIKFGCWCSKRETRTHKSHKKPP